MVGPQKIPIKAIIFDYFGVISSDEFFLALKRRESLSAEFDEISHAVNKGMMTWNDFCKTIASATDTVSYTHLTLPTICSV